MCIKIQILDDEKFLPRKYMECEFIDMCYLDIQKLDTISNPYKIRFRGVRCQK
jgi:hypothetical protein